MNCQWAHALTRYDCRQAKAVDGSACLEIGTPFSLPDGSAINLYLVEAGSHVRLTDNADTMFQLGGMGLDVWQSTRMSALRDFVQRHRLQLSDSGELFMLARQEHAAAALALSISGLIAVSHWAAEKLEEKAPPVDLVAELQPYIIARDPGAKFIPHPSVRGASRAVHTFDMQHGTDLIDVIQANANATAHAMRKAGDVLNGPYAEQATPLIVVDDRPDPERAGTEIGILGSLTRAKPFSSFLSTFH
jgi:hypothetical protein